LTPGIRAERSVRAEQGALITRVTPRIQQALGIQAGDVIFGVNNRAVATAAAIKQAIDQAASRGIVRLHVERRGQQFSTDFRVR
jgi:S1-C subfamily serine protease